MPRPLTAAQTELRINEIIKDLEALTLRTQAQVTARKCTEEEDTKSICHWWRLCENNQLI